MDKRNITIITGTGPALGTGHYQRMLNLAVNLNRTGIFRASILLREEGFPRDTRFEGFHTDSLPDETDLIIRDMRDSLPDEIDKLRRVAPVLVIDDSGDGRDFADYDLTLLPVPSENINDREPDMSRFLFGYNFSEGVTSLADRIIPEKDIDIVVYAGYNPPDNIISEIKKAIPYDTVALIMKRGEALTLNPNSIPSGITYPAVIARAKIVVTHFGLTMFEADACGCIIAALNPTEYHSRLTGIISGELPVIYSSEYEKFAPELLKEVLVNELRDFTETGVDMDGIIKKINKGMENFINYITEITG